MQMCTDQRFYLTSWLTLDASDARIYQLDKKTRTDAENGNSSNGIRVKRIKK